MQTQHLSRLCHDGDIEAIVSYLKTKVDVPVSATNVTATPSLHTSTSNEQTDITVTGSKESCENERGNEQDEINDTKTESTVATSEIKPQYMSGIWGYRDPDGRTVFHWAVAVENYTLAKALMSPPYNAPVLSEDDSHTTPFMTACTLAAPIDFLETLLNRSAEVYDAYMHWRARHDEEILTHIQGHNLPVEEEQQQVNVEEKKEEEQPQENNVQEKGNNRKGMCSTNKNVESTEPTTHTNIELIRRTIVNWEDDLGNTSLFLAVRKGQKEVVLFLLQHGANLMHQNKRGQSVLHRAVMSAKLHLIEELVLYSEKLHAAKKKCHREWMNLQDKRGDSALFYASSDDNEDIGVYLLRHGADRHLRNKEGKEFWEVEANNTIKKVKHQFEVKLKF